MKLVKTVKEKEKDKDKNNCGPIAGSHYESVLQRELELH